MIVNIEYSPILSWASGTILDGRKPFSACFKGRKLPRRYAFTVAVQFHFSRVTRRQQLFELPTELCEIRKVAETTIARLLYEITM